ncbi:MAG: glycosyltransferase [Verrucomicrobia bacterium]|nr:glycosyltransferase [Verrucomicrobiota bacterium]
MTVCLNMIVRDEADVIRRCLESVKDLIDYWVVVDTGSVDGTQRIVKEWLEGIPGELHERPWVDFEYNRNEALQLAKEKGDYLLLIDADDRLEKEAGFRWPKLEKDYYVATQNDGVSGIDTKWMLLISTRLNWRWEGIIHEGLVCKEAKSFDLLTGIVNLYLQDGARSKDPKKVQKIIEKLKELHEKDPADTKTIFYLAESHRGLKNFPTAIEYYKKRIALGGWPEEVFWCMYCVALLERELGLDFEKSYWDAYRQRPSRIEPLYDLCAHAMQKGDFETGYKIAKAAAAAPLSLDNMYVSRWIYEWGALLQLTICASNLGKKEECADLVAQLIIKKNLPDDLRRLLERYG